MANNKFLKDSELEELLSCPDEEFYTYLGIPPGNESEVDELDDSDNEEKFDDMVNQKSNADKLIQVAQLEHKLKTVS